MKHQHMLKSIKNAKSLHPNVQYRLWISQNRSAFTLYTHHVNINLMKKCEKYLTEIETKVI